VNRQPTPAELDALAAWWLSKRHIGKAAGLLGKQRQTVANQLQVFKRMEGATDCVELALKYMDEIQERRASVLDRAA
jgi:hypothetical protein